MKLYELADGAGNRFSPYCWRARMALGHKRLEAEPSLVRFVDVPEIEGGASKTVPVLRDGERVVSDSFAIAEYLDETYPHRPLFRGEAARAHCRFIEAWANTVLQVTIFPDVLADICDRLDPADQDYFRSTREARVGKSLELCRSEREMHKDSVMKALTPLRATLRRQPFLGGDEPDYADYIVFGSLMWPRVVSPWQFVEPGDAVAEWFERCLDLHGGVARAQAAAA